MNTEMKPDLTRWNRAGLSRLAYIDGNAATYLEDLRTGLRQLFAGDTAIQRWLGDPANDATLRDWQRRLLEQYRGPRRDYAWELLRSFARAVHVLAHTANAVSNERYLRTATQWDNVRRLVAMLDYHPAPPASAETWLALIARSETEAVGSIETGLAVQNTPSDGSAPVIFETLADLEVDYRLNALRAPDFDRSPLFVTLGPGQPLLTLELALVPESLSRGQRALLHDHSQAVAVRLESLGTDSLTLAFIDQFSNNRSLPLADLKLEVTAEWQQAPRLNGDRVVQVDPAPALRSGDVLVHNGSGGYSAVRVLAVDGDRLQLDRAVPQGQALYPAQPVRPQWDGGHHRLIMPASLGYDWTWLDDPDLSLHVTSVKPAGDIADTTLYRYPDASLAARAWYLASGTSACCRVVDTVPAPLRFDGDPGELASGQWLLLKGEAGWYSRRIAAIEQDDTGFALELDDLPAGERWLLAEGQFAQSLKDRRHDRNDSSAFLPDTDGSGLSSRLQVRLADRPPALVAGRMLWLDAPDGGERVSIGAVEPDPTGAPTITLKVTPAQDPARFPKSDTRIYGNLVQAGHGESKPEAVLGSGDRVRASQQFVYQRRDIAFVRDSQFASGVRAAVRVWVDDREWSQVDNLRDSEAADSHFQQQLTQDGDLLLSFGDGEHGQRLPSGNNNVRIRARAGHGLAGNLPAGSLDKLKKPHDLLEGVHQPVAATGGGELEPVESLRDNAPASVLTLSRAVSVRDFQTIAEANSSVWHARARALDNLPGASDRIEVTVVPAGGGDLGELAGHLAQTLQRQACPGVRVQVLRYEGLLLELEVRIRVDSAAYDPDQVAARLRDALIDGLSLECMTLGTPLYRSRLYQLIESVEGVENADCMLNPNGFFNDQGLASAPAHLFTGSDGSIRRISPRPGQLLYLNATLAPPVIHTEVYDV